MRNGVRPAGAAAALLLLGCAAAPARAADLGTLDCVVTTLDPAVRKEIETDTARNLTESGHRPSYAATVGSGIGTAAAECARTHGWSPTAVRAASIFALAKLGLPIAQRVVSERGFDPAVLEDAFQALPDDVRSRPLTATETQALVRSVVTDEAQQTRENAELLAEFFAFLNSVQYASIAFANA